MHVCQLWRISRNHLLIRRETEISCVLFASQYNIPLTLEKQREEVVSSLPLQTPNSVCHGLQQSRVGFLFSALQDPPVVCFQTNNKCLLLWDGLNMDLRFWNCSNNWRKHFENMDSTHFIHPLQSSLIHSLKQRSSTTIYFYSDLI